MGKKNLKVGVQEITVQHFTNEITNLPFIMDSNCFIVFSLLWRRYMSHSLNENLITEDGWFQYTMKSLCKHCGFKDKGTLHRAVEGLYRSGIVDVRAESGSRLWACWKMNKNVIERISSLSDRDAMDEPYLKSITSIESKDKEFTYLNNKEGIDDLTKFFCVQAKGKNQVNPSENPPLFNTITLQNNNSIKQQNNNTIKQQNNTELEDSLKSTEENKTVSNDFFNDFKNKVDSNLVGENENELLDKKAEIMTRLEPMRIEIGSSTYQRCKSYLNRKYQEAVASM